MKYNAKQVVVPILNVHLITSKICAKCGVFLFYAKIRNSRKVQRKKKDRYSIN